MTTRAVPSIRRVLTKSVGQYLRQDGYQLISPSFRKSKVLRVCLASRAVPWSPRGAVVVRNRVQDWRRGARRSLAWAARTAPPFAGGRHPAFLAHRGGLGSPGCALGSAPGTAGAAAAPAAVVSRWAGCGAALPGGAGSCARGTAARRIALLSPRSSAAAGKESRGVPGTPLQERGAGEGAKGPSPLRPGVPPRETAAGSVRGGTGEGLALALLAPSGGSAEGTRRCSRRAPEALPPLATAAERP